MSFSSPDPDEGEASRRKEHCREPTSPISQYLPFGVGSVFPGCFHAFEEGQESANPFGEGIRMEGEGNDRATSFFDPEFRDRNLDGLSRGEKDDFFKNCFAT